MCTVFDEHVLFRGSVCCQRNAVVEIVTPKRPHKYQRLVAPVATKTEDDHLGRQFIRFGAKTLFRKVLFAFTAATSVKYCPLILAAYPGHIGYARDSLSALVCTLCAGFTLTRPELRILSTASRR